MHQKKRLMPLKDGLCVLSQTELQFTNKNTYSIAVGVDEVGRGPLIGNVVTAAVILPNDCKLPLNDSKKLSEKKRLFLAEQIKQEAIDFHVAWATPEEIDELNILQATFLAMRRAVEGLKKPFDVVLVDGNKCPKINADCRAIVKGDGKVAEISAASILAKVTRDEEMMLLHDCFPAYGFAQHKGYPTKLHLEKIRQFGLIEGYRKSFRPVQEILLNRQK